ncbi:MAG: GNAT family N-acetyltransferase [Candidatus Eisenbacteria bacterium]|nr:GNAT family N-acetyltransferase [Candidatus Eisenbacteria bacterium]
MSALIRPATSADAAAVAALAGQLGYPMAHGAARRSLERLADREHGAVLVSEEEGRVAGWIEVGILQALAADHLAVISGLIVDASLRGRGIGSSLLEGAAEWARCRGCARIRVRSNVLRRHAPAFYTSRGYELVKTQNVFEMTL